MDYNMDKVYYQKIQDAEESRSQPEISKEKIKSLKTTRLAQRPREDHKDGQPQKGNLDEAAHPPNPQSRASTANGFHEKNV